MLNTAAPTPEPFGSMADDGFYSKLVSCFFTFFYCRRAILQLIISECNFSQVMSVYCSVYWFREFSVNSKQYFLVDNSLKFSLPIHPAMHKIVWRIYLLRVYSSDQMFCVRTKILLHLYSHQDNSVLHLLH